MKKITGLPRRFGIEDFELFKAAWQHLSAEHPGELCVVFEIDSPNTKLQTSIIECSTYSAIEYPGAYAFSESEVPAFIAQIDNEIQTALEESRAQHFIL